MFYEYLYVYVKDDALVLKEAASVKWDPKNSDPDYYYRIEYGQRLNNNPDSTDVYYTEYSLPVKIVELDQPLEFNQGDTFYLSVSYRCRFGEFPGPDGRKIYYTSVKLPWVLSNARNIKDIDICNRFYNGSRYMCTGFNWVKGPWAFAKNKQDLLIFPVVEGEIEPDVDVDEALEPFAAVTPNPAKNTVMVECSSAISSMEIFNMDGKRVLYRHVSATSDSFDVSDWANGMYVVRITTTNGTVTRKFLVAR